MLGQLLTLIVHAQLILERAELTGLDPDVLDTISEVFCPGLLGTRGRAVWQVVLHRGPTAGGTGHRAQTGYRYRPLRAGVGAGQGALRRLRDEPVIMMIEAAGGGSGESADLAILGLVPLNEFEYFCLVDSRERAGGKAGEYGGVDSGAWPNGGGPPVGQLQRRQGAAVRVGAF